MAEFRAGTPQETAFLAELTTAGLLIESGVSGVYGFNSVFTDVRDRIDDLITRQADDDQAEIMRFPPVIPKKILESSGYLNSFPHLGACIFGFSGSEADAMDLCDAATNHCPWPHQTQTDLVLTPAACYAVYPAVANSGPLPSGGVCIDTGSSFVFRNEPSGDPARLQIFRQREIVRIGEPNTVAAWRDKWRDRAIDIVRALGVDAIFDVASDPFFGRTGRLMAASQKEQALKFEILVPIASPHRTAVASFNYHREHFSAVHGITMSDGGDAHTACLGFGMERFTLSLLRTHGLDPTSWPQEIRRQLWG